MNREYINKSEINISSAALLGPTMLPLLQSPLEVWLAFGQLMDYRGLEWRPLRTCFVPEAQIISGTLTKYAKNGIRSVEQSFRGERSWLEASSSHNKRLAQVSYLLFPHRLDSLTNLGKLQSMLPGIPITVYPEDHDDNIIKNWEHKLVQPAVSVVKQWNVTSFEQLLEEIRKRQLGINLDLFHYLQLRKAFNLPPTEKALEMMFPDIKEVQYSAARTDMDREDEDTALAFKDLMKGTRQSEAMQLLISLKQMGYQGPVVTEVAAVSVGSNPIKFVLTHRLFTKNLKKIFNIN